MKTIFCICLFLGISVSAAADDISGTWVADMDENHIEMNFTIDGTTLTGTVDSSTSGSAQINNGVVDGTNISFHVMRKLQGFGDSEFKISWKGEIIGDEILFKREFAGSSKGVIAKRGVLSSKSEKSLDHLSGTWKGQVPRGEIIINMQVKESAITGSVSFNGNNLGDIKDGKINGDKITFKASRQIGANSPETPFEGTIKGNEIHFAFTPRNIPIPFIAKKDDTKTEDDTDSQFAAESTGPYKDFAGKWIVKWPIGAVNIIDLKINGSEVTGTLTIENSPMRGQLVEGKIEDKKISFKFKNRQMQRQGQYIPWDGTIEGDKIYFDTQYPNGPDIKLIAVRKGAEEQEDDTGSQLGAESTGPYKHLAGKWNAKWPIGRSSIIDLTINGSTVSGTVRNENAPMVNQIVDGKIDDNKISFKQQQMQSYVTWDGTIEGDRIFFDTKLPNGRGFKLVAMREGAEEQQEEQTNDQLAAESTGPNKHLAGKWAVKMPNSSSTIIDLKVKDSTVSGSLKNEGTLNRNQIFNGKIEGKKISFKEQQMQRSIPWDGIISGEKIFFTTQYPNGRSFIVVAMRESAEEEKDEKEEVQLPSTVDPGGTWTMEVNDQQYAIGLKLVGMSLSGMAKVSPPARIFSLSDAKINGNTISFKMPLSPGTNSYTTILPVTGKVVGEEIRFEGAPFGQEEDIIAKKIKGSSGDPNEKEPITLVRDEKIKNKKVNKKYEKLRKKDSEYNSAMEYYDEYRYNLALPLFEQVYKRLPDDTVLLHRLGVCLIMQSIFPAEISERRDMRIRARGLLERAKKQGVENELLEYYLKVIPENGGEDDIFSKQKEAEDILSEAEKAFGLYDYQTSIDLYARAMEFDPSSYKAVLYVGDSYFANGQYKDAIVWFKRSTKVSPDKETAWRFWGDCLIRLDKKEEGRSKYIDALIAEPYNPLSWNGPRYLIDLIRRELKRNNFEFKAPDIQRPQRLEDTGELLVSEKNNEPDDDHSKSTSDGTEVWQYYNDVVKEWRSEKFNKNYPDEEKYRHTLKEEKEALTLVAEKVNELIKKDRIKTKNLDPGLKTLLELDSSDMLEAYILFHLADRDIINEYPDYRKSNRDKLKQYLDRFEVPKFDAQQEL